MPNYRNLSMLAGQRRLAVYQRLMVRSTSLGARRPSLANARLLPHCYPDGVWPLMARTLSGIKMLFSLVISGAGEGIRTLDPNLGN
jgi:hypothetical protein